MNLNDQRYKFNEIAKVIQTKTGDSETTFPALDFEEQIRAIDRLRAMNAIQPGSLDNGYIGYEVAACARSYVNSRSLSGTGGTDERVRWNYNQENIFDAANGVYSLRGNPDGHAPAQVGMGSGNLIDCSSFVGLVLRGLDYAHSPYTQHPGDTWVPNANANNNKGIRRLTEDYGAAWGIKALDYQPPGFEDLGYTGYSTIRTAADLAEFLYKTGDIIYDSARDGAMEPVKSGTTTIGFKGENMSSDLVANNLIFPGDIVIWAKKAWYHNGAKVTLSSYGFRLASGVPHIDDTLTVTLDGENVTYETDAGETLAFTVDAAAFKTAVSNVDGEYTFTQKWSQPDRFRQVSHIAIASENPAYVYEATTMKETLYYRKLLPTTKTVNGIYGEICMIIRPDYRPKVAQTYAVPLNENLLVFPWNFTRLNNEDRSPAAATRGIFWKMLGANKLGLWGNNQTAAGSPGTYDASLKGSTSQPYNRIRLTPGTYEMEIKCKNHSGTDTPNGAGFALYLKHAGHGTECDVVMDDGIATESMGSTEIPEIDEDVLETAGVVGNTGDPVRAYSNRGPIEFTIPATMAYLDVCVRIHMGENRGGSPSTVRGYTFGNYPTTPRQYSVAEVSLKRTS